MNWLITGVNGLQEWQQRLDRAKRATSQERRHQEQLKISLATQLAKYQQFKKAAFSRGPLRRNALIANFLEGGNMDFEHSQTALTLGLDPLQVQLKLNQLSLHASGPMLACIYVGLHQYWLATILACVNVGLM